MKIIKDYYFLLIGDPEDLLAAEVHEEGNQRRSFLVVGLATGSGAFHIWIHPEEESQLTDGLLTTILERTRASIRDWLSKLSSEDLDEPPFSQTNESLRIQASADSVLIQTAGGRKVCTLSRTKEAALCWTLHSNQDAVLTDGEDFERCLEQARQALR